jgi:sRNA-binding carbon storage regulator CsrA
MLVISRVTNESVIIWDRLSGEELGTVQLVAIRGKKIRLGFQFQDWIGIVRKEAREKKDEATNGN